MTTAGERGQPDARTPRLPDAASFETLVRWRRDVRRFKPDPVSRELLDDLIRVSDLAPSVGNSQPWRIVEIVSPELRSSARANFERANQAAAEIYGDERRQHYQALKLAGFDRAPVHLVICCDPNPGQGHGLGRQTQPLTLDYSCAGFVAILWLAARTRGLGLGWVSILDPEVFIAQLGVPEGWRFVGYLLLGYPQEEHEESELSRAGWQSRTPCETRRLVR